MKLLNGKVALITGASRGIGKGIVEKFAEHGANVAFTYASSKEKAEALQKQLEEHGGKAAAYQSNAADFTACEELINAVITDFGTIDVLVNNAGITRDGLLMRMTEEHWDEVIETNLKSVYNTTKAIQRTFLKQRSGSIINLTSIVGLKAMPGRPIMRPPRRGS